MYILKIILCLLLVVAIGFGLSYIFRNNLAMEEGYIFGVITVFILWIIFGNKSNNQILKKNKSLFNIIALTCAFIGGLLWFFGEYLVYTGKPDHVLLDPIGSFACALGALIALIIYLYE